MRALVGLAVAGFLLAAGPAQAATPQVRHAPEFAVQAVEGASAKGWFILDALPGTTRTGTLRIVNSGDRTGTVRLDVVDATTGRTSGAVYRDRSARTRDVGAWTTLGRSRVTLHPGKSTVVPFTVVIPQNARPGQHLGGIVAEQTQKPANDGGKGRFRVKVRRQTIVALQLDLPGGEAAAIESTGVRSGPQSDFPTLLLGLRSPGETIVTGKARVVVEDEDGDVVGRAAFALDTFVPGSRISYPVALKQRLAPGEYTAKVVTRSAGESVEEEYDFRVTDSDQVQSYGSRTAADALGLPAWVLVAVLVLALALVGTSFVSGIAIARRRTGRAHPAAPRDVVAGREVVAASVSSRP